MRWPPSCSGSDVVGAATIPPVGAYVSAFSVMSDRWPTSAYAPHVCSPVHHSRHLLDLRPVHARDRVEVDPKLIGIVGGVLFLSIIAFSLSCVVRAARRFERMNERTMELLTRSLLVALIGLLTADFFISEMFAKQLWLLLSLGPALLSVAESMERHVLEEEDEGDPEWRPESAGTGRTLVPAG